MIRVLSRVCRFEEDFRGHEKEFWALSEGLIPDGHAREFNQALMELGALVCTPKKPRCSDCPLQKQCRAKKAGVQESIPVKRAMKAKTPIQVAVGVIQKNGKIFIEKRRNEGLMAGLWEFPGGHVESGERPMDALRREIGEELGISIKNIKPFMQLKHSYTRYTVDLHCFLADYGRGRVRLKAATKGLWTQVRDLKKFPFPAANVRLIKKLNENLL